MQDDFGDDGNRVSLLARVVTYPLGNLVKQQ